MAKILQNQELTPEVMERLTKDQVDWVYNGLDVAVTDEVYDKQLESADEVALNTYKFSMTLAAPVFEMTLRGVMVDEDARLVALKKFEEHHEIIEHNLRRVINEGVGITGTFNYRSLPQLKMLFYKVLGLKPVLKRNAEGIYVPSVDREALEKLQRYLLAEFFVLHVLVLRELDKKIQVLKTDLDDDGKMRTSYNIAGTNTGRLSSSTSDYDTGGNQQNIERALRAIFVPDPGMKFCNIDLEQADARNVGAICWELFVDKLGEKVAGSYLDACESGDLHTFVCRMAYTHLPWPQDRKEWRAIADQNWYRTFSYRDGSKKLGHGTNYYGTPATMAAHTKVDEEIIAGFQERYFEGFPVIGAVKRNDRNRLIKDLHAPCWHNWVREQIDQFGFITTPHFNRRRYFFGRPDDDRTVREAIAYAPQSMTADEIDTGIINLWRWGRVHPLIQVHDSILFQFPEELEDEIVPEAIKRLTIKWDLKKGREFFVPVEAKVGYNWADVEFKKDGTVKANPNGLIKYKPGTDLRKRPNYRSAARPRTLLEALNA